MRACRRSVVACALLLGLFATEAGAAKRPPAKLRVTSLIAPAKVQHETPFTVRGRVYNQRKRRTQKGRLTIAITANARARDSRVLRAAKVRRLRGGRSRRFSLKVRVPAGVPAAVFHLRACVKPVPSRKRPSCRSRRILVAPPAQPPGNPPGNPPGPPAPAEPGPLQSLRAPVTGEHFYFVMADRFEDGSDANDHGGLPPGKVEGTSGFDPTGKGWYHGGDLKGLTERIDYIQGLGTTAIWLTPSFKNKAVQDNAGFPSAGYHGYWITDFTEIDPHLGTNADLAALVDAAHARGMKVYFDIITNHTADVITYTEGAAPGYVSKDEEPYRTSAGTPFDDRDYAGTASFPALDPAVSFPYTPVNPPDAATPGSQNHKVPSWLNDVTLYHNRGNTTFAGENAYYGDFFGLDDLFTEHPRVVDGMVEIYKAWIRDFGIDGFRIDTMKHVNDEFWQRFAPEVLDYARAQGKREFFMFGEVFDTTKQFTSHFTTRDRVQAVLDFPFQAAAQGFAANSTPASRLREFFVADDWYTDADSNAYQLPTFLGNHDMGRIGRFVATANGGASDEELLARDRLAHELMYFARGNPVVYYGDEQGFTGDGGDQDARQDMFPSQVASYNDDDLIGTAETTAEENFDPEHPLYQAIAELAGVSRDHAALRNGAQQHRYASDAAGIYAFSRLDRAQQREYVVALNNSEEAKTAFVPTAAAAGAGFARVYPDRGPATVAADDRGRLELTVPPLSTVVYRSLGPIPRSPAPPPIAVAARPEGGDARDRVEVRAFVSGDSFYDVAFHAKVGDGEWAPIGTDDNAPYRVFHDIAHLDPGTTVTYRAVVLDNEGHSRASQDSVIRVAPPEISMLTPADGGGARESVTVTAGAVPDRNDYSVTFQRLVGDGEWTAIGTDASQPSPYRVTDDISSLAAGTIVSYRAVLTYAPGRTVTSEPRSVTVTEPVTTAVIHYHRPAGDYSEWGLHLWGDGLAPGEATAAWTSPSPFEGTDAYGAFRTIEIADDTKPVGFIVHGMPPNENTKDTDSDRFFTPAEHPEIWLKQGDPTIYTSPPPT